MEPLITGGGILTPHPVYLEKVQEICNKHGVLLIIDEVICGFGQTGKNFGHQHFGLRPDIVTMAKGLTSAYLPLSVTAVRRDIYEKFKDIDGTSHLRHVNTFGGNPAACAVALKNIEIMERENLVEHAAQNGNRLQKEFGHLINHPNVGDIRGLGFLLGIELVEEKETREPAKPERIAKIIGDCKVNILIIGKNGDAVAGYNNVLSLSPPLSCTDEEVDFIISVIKKVFEDNRE
jgi:taurine-pyruvate aminotransferase